MIYLQARKQLLFTFFVLTHIFYLACVRATDCTVSEGRTQPNKNYYCKAVVNPVVMLLLHYIYILARQQ